MLRRTVTALVAAGFAMAGLVAVTAPAHATTEAVSCPGSVMSGGNQVLKRGRLVDEYWLSKTAVAVYEIDDRYEAYVTDGNQIKRACFKEKPERPKDAKDETPKPATGGGGGRAQAPGFGGFGWGLGAFPPAQSGKVTVGPVESVS